MDRCTYTEFVADGRERRCVKDQHDVSRNHLLATMHTLDDLVGLGLRLSTHTAEEAN